VDAQSVINWGVVGKHKLTIHPSSDGRRLVYYSDRQALSTTRFRRVGSLATADARVVPVITRYMSRFLRWTTSADLRPKTRHTAPTPQPHYNREKRSVMWLVVVSSHHTTPVFSWWHHTTFINVVWCGCGVGAVCLVFRRRLAVVGHLRRFSVGQCAAFDCVCLTVSTHAALSSVFRS